MIIKKYYDRYGFDNVLVYPYEELVVSPDMAMNNISIFLGISSFESNLHDKVVNKSRGAIGIFLERRLNALGINNRYTQHIIGLMPSLEKTYKLNPPEYLLKEWRESNKITQEIAGIDLEKHSYLL